jgi:glycosyltransferase involved in cell wall biosynthesis
MTFPDLTVVVPTFNRPDGLTKAVLSLFAQRYVKTGFTLIIVDNAPDNSALQAIETLRKVCPQTITLIALHEPNAGVANARNKAMGAVATDLVAFLDDDQSAPDDWLERILENHARFPAPVTFGPVVTALPETQKRHRAYFSSFFAREPDLKSGYTERSFGCGNALIDFSMIPDKGPWFDVLMNEIGGEDDMLFERIRDSGGQFAWAANAPVLEYPLPSRISLSYTLRRAFSYGQGPVTLARLATPQRRLDMLKWMAIGAGKAVWHGFQWFALSLIRHPNRAFQLDKAVRGASKVLWFIDFRFYGQAAVDKSIKKMRWFKPRRRTAAVEADAKQ